MQKLSTYLRRLFQACILAIGASAVAACAFDPAEGEGGAPSAEVSQPQSATPCYPYAFSSWTFPSPPSTSNVRVSMKIRNMGTVTCPVKISVDMYQHPLDSGVDFATPVYGPFTLQANEANEQLIHGHYAPFGRRCYYRIWAKYRPDYPNGSEVWRDITGISGGLPANC